MSEHTESNRKAFNDFAASYDAHPWQLKIASLLIENLRQRKEWLGAQWHKEGEDREVKLLDYACGTGAASMALLPFVTSICGMDLSEGMIEKYNEMIDKSDLRGVAHGIVADLTDSRVEATPEAKDKYDVAIISLALHHVNDPQEMLRVLSARLKPAGVLIVIDFLPFQHQHHTGKHDMSHTIKQHGFTKDDMSKLYEATGFSEFAFDVVSEPLSMGEGDKGRRDMFIARGQV